MSSTSHSPRRVTARRSTRRTRRLGLALDGAEGAEIVLAQQHLRRVMHARRIERPPFPGGAPRGQRRARIAIEDEVAVAARPRAVARVKMRRRPRAPRRRSRPGVDRCWHRGARRVRCGPHRCRNAPPAPARARRHRCGPRRRNRPVRPRRAKGALHHVLDGVEPGLDLPAGIRATVVFQAGGDARHRGH